MTTSSQQPFLPVRDRSEPFDLGRVSDDIDAATNDPAERQVLRNIATELAIAVPARTVGDVLDALEQAGPAARGALLDRAREKAGVPSLEQEAIDNVNIYPARYISRGPERYHDGTTDALCGHPGCLNGIPGEQVGSYKRVKCLRWYCDEHADTAERREQMATEWTGPRYGYGPSGVMVDLDEQEAEKQKAALREQHRQAEVAERDAEAARDSAALQEHREAARRRDALENRHQTGYRP